MARKRSVAVTTPPVSGAAVSEESDVGMAADRIRQRAHAIYEQRTAMGLPGDAEADWLQAEAELGGKTPTKP